MKLTTLFFVVAACIAATPARAADSWTLASPDGSLQFVLRLEAPGTLRYAVYRSGEVVLASSPLGVTRGDQAFVTGLKFSAAGSLVPVDETYVALHGKRRSIRHRAREMVVSFVNEAGAPLDVIVRVADDGAAFRYRFPAKDAVARAVTGEATGFAVPNGSTAWILPRMPAGKYTPAYEGLFVEVPAGSPA